MVFDDTPRPGVLPFRVGELLPRLTLTSLGDGGTTTLRDGRGPRVIAILHGSRCEACRAYWRTLASVEPRVAEWEGRLLVILADDSGPRETPAYGDPKGDLASYAPALVVADEWGEVYEAMEAGAEHAWPAPDEVLEWVRFIAIQCPECEAPEGDWLGGAS